MKEFLEKKTSGYEPLTIFAKRFYSFIFIDANLKTYILRPILNKQWSQWP